MRKLLILFSILLITLFGCSNDDESKEVFRVTGHDGPNVELIENEGDIAAIKEIMDKVEWTDEESSERLTRPDEKYDYQFWLSKGEERLKSWEAWYEEGRTIIFSSGKTGELNDSDAQKLEQYLINAF